AFVDITLKILPLLYLKTSMIAECEMLNDEVSEDFVTEDDYEVMRLTIASILGEKDDYLEVFLPEMAYSDVPIKKCISEDLTDIYQDLKNFVSVFKLGFDQTMNDSLVLCKEHFELFWGQTLVNTLGALHDVKYNVKDDEIDENDMLNE
ncbi:MAG: DUF5063 domain-containing protein, partial [Bacteroidaceae bacterium]